VGPAQSSEVSVAKLSAHDNPGVRMPKPYSAHRRIANAVPPGGMAEAGSARDVHRAARSWRLVAQKPLDARDEITARNKGGPCDNVLY
jgi:hypothetical protein